MSALPGPSARELFPGHPPALRSAGPWREPRCRCSWAAGRELALASRRPGPFHAGARPGWPTRGVPSARYRALLGLGKAGGATGRYRMVSGSRSAEVVENEASGRTSRNLVPSSAAWKTESSEGDRRRGRPATAQRRSALESFGLPAGPVAEERFRLGTARCSCANRDPAARRKRTGMAQEAVSGSCERIAWRPSVTASSTGIPRASRR